MEPEHNTQSLHDLVTLEPSFHNLTRDGSHFTASSSGQSLPREYSHRQQPSRQPSSILVTSPVADADENASRNNVNQIRPTSISRKRSSRWPFLKTTSRANFVILYLDINPVQDSDNNSMRYLLVVSFPFFLFLDDEAY